MGGNQRARILKNSFTTLFSLICFSLFSFTLCAQTQGNTTPTENVPDLLVKANTAYIDKDYVVFRDSLIQLRKLRPNNSDYMYQLVIAYALLDKKSSAYDLMLRMQQQGLGYDFAADANSVNLQGTQVFDYVDKLLKQAMEPMGESEPVFTLPQSLLAPEAITWDESRQKFLIGSVAEGRIYAVGKDGQIEELLVASDENGMWAVFDLLVDQARNRLWVSSAATPRFSRHDSIDQGRSGLFEFELDSLKFVRRYPVPVDGRPHNLGSMVQNPAGDIFIVDRILPIIYRKPVGEKKLKAVMASNEMVSMRGIAIQADGRIMYVADRELGILVIDIEAGRARKLAVASTLNLGGIDGLYLWENHLIVIQNGIKPERIMRLQLDASGTRVVGVRPLAVAKPEFDYPNFGVVLEGNLYFFGNSQWPDGDTSPKPVTVLRTPLSSSDDLIQPDMQEFLKRRATDSQTQQD